MAERSIRSYFDRPILRGPVVQSRAGPTGRVNWSRLKLLPRPDVMPPPVRDMAEARQRLKQFVKQGDERIESLRNFLADNNIELGAEDSQIDRVNSFFVNEVYSNEEVTDIRINWVFFIWNYSLFLGNVLIDRAREFRKLRWTARNVAVKAFGENIRVVFEVGGYRSVHFEPDDMMVQIGRFMLCANQSDPTEGGRFLDLTTGFSRRLADSLRLAE